MLESARFIPSLTLFTRDNSAMLTIDRTAPRPRRLIRWPSFLVLVFLSLLFSPIALAATAAGNLLALRLLLYIAFQ